MLVTIVVSITALWALARIRFADRPLPQNPITPVLSQLSPPPVFDQLTSTLVQIQSRLTPWLLGIDTRRSGSFPARHAQTVAALRLDAETAVALFDETTISDDADLVAVQVTAQDPASGLAVLRVLTPGAPDAVSQLAIWSSQRPASSRYLVAAEVSSAGVSVRPVFVGALQAIESPVWWSEMAWQLPASIDLSPGTFVFTMDGALVGLVADIGGRLAIVPGETVKTAASRLAAEGQKAYGQLGIEAQPLIAGTAVGTSAQSGVVVTAVDLNGPAGEQLQVTDIIEAVGDKPLPTYEHWHAIAARVTVGQTISLRVKRTGEVRTVVLTALPPTPPAEALRLGLTMRTIPGTGVEVLAVAAGSAAARAGIRPGDVVTIIGDRKAPTPTQVTRSFVATTADQPVLVGVTRGAAHHVLTLQKR